MNKLYDTNPDFFKSWSEGMAYILGWIATDGCIQYVPKKRYGLRFELADKEPLLLFKEIMNLDHPIHENKERGHYSLYIRDKKLVKSIIDIGITPNKTFTLQPLAIPQEYMPHFIRGVFDGDGSVFILNRRNGDKTLGSKILMASKEFIQWLGDTLRDELGLIPKIYQDKGRYYALRYGAKESMALYKYMYDDAKYYLTRKRKVFEEAHEFKYGLGIAPCKRCGKEIVRTSNRQKWCNNCKKVVVKEQDLKKRRKKALRCDQ